MDVWDGCSYVIRQRSKVNGLPYSTRHAVVEVVNEGIADLIAATKSCLEGFTPQLLIPPNCPSLSPEATAARKGYPRNSSFGQQSWKFRAFSIAKVVNSRGDIYAASKHQPYRMGSQGL